MSKTQKIPDVWDAYNHLLLSADIERLRKLLARAELFRMTQDVPGDVVECGVLKGTGLMLWAKLLRIHCPGSAKRVVGFDVFDGELPTASPEDATAMAELMIESSFNGISTDELQALVEATGLERGRCELVAGDIAQTAAAYVKANPGFRISLLHLDMDLEHPTAAALDAFWERIPSGGIVVFDEYAVSRWSESNAVDAFAARRQIALRTVSWFRTPTAYCLKP